MGCFLFVFPSITSFISYPKSNLYSLTLSWYQPYSPGAGTDLLRPRYACMSGREWAFLSAIELHTCRQFTPCYLTCLRTLRQLKLLLLDDRRKYIAETGTIEKYN